MDSWAFASEVPEGEAEPEPLASLAKLESGQHFGPFSLREELGRGGFGVVFRARETSSRRELALKIMTRPLQEQQRARFLREGELTASLRHPGIVRIHSAGEADGLPYLAYELVPEGLTLRPYLRPERREEALDLLGEVATALGHAHTLGVVHRDLKPDNVLVTSEGRARVADFGLARRDTDDALTRTGALVGTPSHMSPEQFRGDPVGAPSDVWALGVLLYEALTGELPFQASALLELSVKVAQEPLVPASKRLAGVEPALDAVCRRALAKDPLDRYPNGAAFAAALAQARLNLHYSVARGRARRGLLGALVGLSLVAGAVWLSQPASNPDAIALLAALEAPTPDPAALEAALRAAGEGAPAPLRAASHLRLATTAPPSERAEHARAALALGADPREGELALALALSDSLGESPSVGPELIVALERARAAGTRPSLLAPLALSEAQALAASGQQGVALKLLRTRLERPVNDRASERQLWALRARLELELDPKAAQESLTVLDQRGTPGDAAALRADVALAGGSDPRATLVAALLKNPSHGGLQLRLARLRLAEGQVATARAILCQTSPTGQSAARMPGDDWSPASARVVISGLAAHPPTLPSPDAVPASWREPLARWALREARRAQGLADWAATPLNSTGEGAPAPSVFVNRAQALARLASELAAAPETRARSLALRSRLEDSSALLDQARDLAPNDPQVRWELARRAREGKSWAAALIALGSAPSGVQESAARRELRGEALLRQGSAAKALPHLRAALGPRELDPRRARLLVEALTKLPAPSASQRAELTRLEALAALLQRPPPPSAGKALAIALLARREQVMNRHKVESLFENAVKLGPRDLIARLHLARLNFVESGDPDDLREFLWAGAKSAEQFEVVWRDLLHLSRGLIEEVYLTSLEQRYPRERREDRLLGALIGVATVEFEGQLEAIPRILKVLEAWLEEEPGSHAALRARAFLLLRSGLLDEAERELAILREATPACHLVAFYQLLCAAQRKAPLPDLVARIEELSKARFLVWRAPNWTIQLYPELAPHAAEPGFAPVLGPKDQ